MTHMDRHHKKRRIPLFWISAFFLLPLIPVLLPSEASATNPTISSLQQRVYLGSDACHGNEATVPENGTIDTFKICLEAHGDDADPSDSIRVVFEVKPNGTAFNGTDGLYCWPGPGCGPTGAKGGQKTVLIENPNLTYNTPYHWRAKVVDSTAAESAWVEFDTGATPDFTPVNQGPVLTNLIQRDDPTNPPCQLNETPVAVGGTINGREICLQALIDDAADTLIRLEVEVKPVNSTFNGTGVFCYPGDCTSLVSETNRAARATGLVFGTDYHWRARGIDEFGLAGAWTTFATNGEGSPADADFKVVNAAPTINPSTVQQRLLDFPCRGLTAPVPLGDGIDTQALCLEGIVIDANPIRFEVEVKNIDSAFSNTATHCWPTNSCNTYGTPGTLKQITADNLNSDPQRKYHWQYRAVDDGGLASAWTAFATNGDSPPAGSDFQVNNPAPTITNPDQRVNSNDPAPCSPGASVAVGGSVAESSICLEALLTDAIGVSVHLEVEVKQVGTNFDGTGILCGSSVGTLCTDFGAQGVRRVTVTGLLNSTAYHWRARAVDKVGSVITPGAWVPFGGNNDPGDADFSRGNDPPTISSLAQRNPTTASCLSGDPQVTEGDTIFKKTICLWADVADSNNARLEVQVQEAGIDFDSTVTPPLLFCSPTCSTTASTVGVQKVTATGLEYGKDYHWRARGFDQLGASSSWVEFGSINNIDFEVRNGDPSISQIDQRETPDGVCHAGGDLFLGVGGQVPETTVCFNAHIEDSGGDLVRLEIEVKPVGTPFSNTRTDCFPGDCTSFATGGQIRVITKTGLSLGTSYHWQARVVDNQTPSLNTGWQAFGGNNDPGDTDFTVQNLTPIISNVQQRDPGATACDASDTLLAEGGSINQPTICFTADILDNNKVPDQQVRFEVELKEFSSGFSGTATLTSAFVTSGVSGGTTTHVITATIPNIQSARDYHWKYRAVDNTTRADGQTPWTEFKTASNIDFHVNNNPPVFGTLKQRSWDGSSVCSTGGGTPEIPDATGTVDRTSMCVEVPVTDPDSDLVRFEVEMKPVGTAFNGSAPIVQCGPNPDCVTLAAGTTFHLRMNNIVPLTSYKWVVTAIDSKGATAVLEYEQGAFEETDFTMNNAPPVITSGPVQAEYDGNCLDGTGPVVPEGGNIDESFICLETKGDDTGDPVLTDEPLTFEVEVREVGTAFTNTLTDSVSGASNTFMRITKAVVNGKNYHWQYRVRDSKNISTPWTEYLTVGTPPNDFTVSNTAPTISALAQLRVDCATPIADEGTTLERNVCFKSDILDADSSAVRMEVEVYTGASSLVTSGTTALVPHTPGGGATSPTLTLPSPGFFAYGLTAYWRARAIDDQGVPSAWTDFETGSSPNDDFTVKNEAPTLATVEQRLDDDSVCNKSGSETVIPLGNSIQQKTVCFNADLTDLNVNPSQTIQLQVEVQPVGTAFACSGTGACGTATISPFVSSGSTAFLRYGALNLGNLGTVPDANLSALWHLDENSATFADSSGNGNTGTGTATSSTTSGHSMRAPFFNGSAFVSMGNTLNFTTGSFSVEAWFNQAVSPATGTTGRIVGKRNNAGAGYDIEVLPDNTIRAHVSNAGTTRTKTITIPFSNDQWMHVVMTVDRTADELQLYLNGAAQGAPSVIGGLSVSNNLSFRLGSDNASANNFTGRIDEVAVYSGYVLSAAEVVDHYQRTNLAYGIGYHWQYRAVDSDGLSSPWATFATNPDPSGVDFAILNNDPTETSVDQVRDSNATVGLCPGTDTSVTLGSNIVERHICFKATVSDSNLRPTQKLHLEVEVQPVGTAFACSGTGACVSPGEVTGPGVDPTQTARVESGLLAYGTSYHWQYRTLDEDGGVSPWSTFGSNPEPGGVDFTPVNVAPTMSGVAQLRDTNTTVGSCPVTDTVKNVGDDIFNLFICFRATLDDANSNPSQTLQLEVEVKPVGTAFDCTGTGACGSPDSVISTSVNPTETIRVEKGGLAYGTSYHWQYRGVDSNGGRSQWFTFATNPDPGGADFNVVNLPPTVTALEQRVYDLVSCDGNEATVPQGGNIDKNTICLEASVSDANANPTNNVFLEVEVLPVGTNFACTGSGPCPTAQNSGGPTAQGVHIVTYTPVAFGTGYHWQARGVDNQGLPGPWVAFGTNTDPNDIDFIPTSFAPVLSNVEQRIYDGNCGGVEAAIPLGATILQNGLCLEGFISDFDSAVARLEVEVQAVGTTFTGTANYFYPTSDGFSGISDIPPGVKQIIQVGEGEGLTFYGLSGSTTPQTRYFSPGLNGFGPELPTLSGVVPVVTRLRASPIKNEAIAGYVDSVGTLNVLCYDGANWSSEWSVSVGGDGTTRRFDIAYETQSGKAMVLYSKNGAALFYRTKPGGLGCGSGNWAGESTFTPTQTTGTIAWVRVEADQRAGANFLAAIWADTNHDLSARTWDGVSTWGNEPTAPLSVNLNRVAAANTDVESFDLTYESLSGDLMVAWGDDGANHALPPATALFATLPAGGGTWTTGGSWTTGDDVDNVDLSSDPLTDRILFVGEGRRFGRSYMNYFNGSAWGTNTTLDLTARSVSAGRKYVSSGWLNNGSAHRGIVVWDGVAAGGATSWSIITPGSGTAYTSSDQTTANPSPGFGSVHSQTQIEMDPYNRQRMMVLIENNAADLFAKRLVMDPAGNMTWSEPDGAVALQSTSLDSGQFKAFDFTYLGRLSYDTSYHWQMRAVDNAGLDSGWFTFGSNGEPGGVDFIVSSGPPTITVGPDQKVDDNNVCNGSAGEVSVPLGAPVSQSSICFDATVLDTSPLPTHPVGLLVEVKPVGTAFACAGSGFCSSAVFSADVFSGGVARVRVGGLSNGSYHWQYRITDRANGGISWTPFATNGDPNGVDFSVGNVAPTVSAEDQLEDSEPLVATCPGTDAPVSLGGAVLEKSICFKGTLTDANPGNSIQLEVEVKPVTVPFTCVGLGACASPDKVTSPVVNSTETARVEKAGLAYGTDYHWQYRAVDQFGGASPWTTFGSNGDPNGVDFSAVNDPPTLAGVDQVRDTNTADGLCPGTDTSIALGGTVPEKSVCFTATLSDANLNPFQTIQLEVEVKPVTVPFTCSGLGACASPDKVTSLSVNDGELVRVEKPNLAYGTDYHWQYRAVDQDGGASPWTTFGSNGDPNGVDFAVRNLPPTLSSVEQREYDGSCDGNEAVKSEGDSILQKTICLDATLNDPNILPPDTVQFQVEVEEVGTNFDGTGIHKSPFLTIGDVAKIPVGQNPLNPGDLGPGVSDSSLLGLWHFDENGGSVALDASGNDNPGSLSIANNILLNPGFESGLTNWTTDVGAGGTVGVDTTVFKEGTQSLKINLTGTTFGRLQAVAVTAGDQYVLSGWLKNSMTDAQTRLQCDVLGTGINSPGIQLFANGDWVYKTETVTIPAGTTSVNIRCFADGTAPTGTGWVDGLSFTNLSDMPTWTSPGEINSALSFNGINNSVTLSAQPDLTGGFTFEGWVNFSDTTDFNNTQDIFNNNQFVLRKNRLGVNNALEAFVQLSDTSTAPRVSATTIPVPGDWYHVAVTWDGTDLRIYVNGVLEATSTRSGSLIGTTVSPQIGVGEFTNTTINPFEGLIDEVAIFNTPLSGPQITDHYQRGAYSLEYGKSYHWRYRAVDSQGLFDNGGSWTEFVTPGVNSVDFTVTNGAPTTNLLQQYNGPVCVAGQELASGATASGNTVCLESNVSDPNTFPSQNVRLEVEVALLGTSFSNTAQYFVPSSVAYTSQGVLKATLNLLGGEYRWQVLGRDELAVPSVSWNPMGGSPDFIIACHIDGVINFNGDNLYGALGSGNGGTGSLVATPGSTTSYGVTLQNEQGVALPQTVSLAGAVPVGWAIKIQGDCNGSVTEVDLGAGNCTTPAIPAGGSGLYTINVTPPLAASATEEFILNLQSVGSACASTSPDSLRVVALIPPPPLPSGQLNVVPDAKEVVNDGIGNDNGTCESGEVCTGFDDQLDLSWADLANSETGYKIERYEGTCPPPVDTDFQQIAVVYSNAIQSADNTGTIYYADKGLKLNTTYCYRVRAFSRDFGAPLDGSEDVNSIYSNQADALTGPGPGSDAANPEAVSDLEVEPYSARYNAISLTWTAPEDDSGDPSSGPTESYILRYSMVPMGDPPAGAQIDFGTTCNNITGSPLAQDATRPLTCAVEVINLPAPRQPGENEHFTIQGRLNASGQCDVESTDTNQPNCVSPNTIYYFALKSVDEQAKVSNLSNLAGGDYARNTGTVSSATGLSLTDGSKAWTPGQWIGGQVAITSGAGSGQVEFVLGNDATTLTIGSGDSGQATNAAANTLSDSNKNWTFNIWQGGQVTILSGTGAGQTRAVTSNGDTFLVVSPNWTVIPSTDSIFVVGNSDRTWSTVPPAASNYIVTLDGRRSGRTALRTAFNLVSTPLIPSPSDPSTVFGDDVGAVANLFKWDSFGLDATTGPVGCYAASPIDLSDCTVQLEVTSVGTVPGYFLIGGSNNPVIDAPVASTEISTSTLCSLNNAVAVPLDVDGGWNIVSSPFLTNQAGTAPAYIPLNDPALVQVRQNGSTCNSWANAVSAGWVQDGLFSFDGATYQMTIAANGALLAPWKSYWIYVAEEANSYELILVKPTP